MIAPKRGTKLLVRQAREIRMYRMLRKLVPSIMATIAVLVTLVYVISVMYTRFGSFTITINKYHSLKYGLSLSETANFVKPTSLLDCRASEAITNIDGAILDDIPDLGALDGNDSGENYLCYSFYCRNTGEEEISYEYAINIANMTMDIEKAIRIRLIRTVMPTDGENDVMKADYARASSVGEDGTVVPEPNTVAFQSKNTIMTETLHDFAPGDTVRYTVVIWLEGNDPDCIDAIIGGSMKVDMKFSVTAVAGVAL